MIVRPYNDSDETKLVELFEANNMPKSAFLTLPKFGLVAIKDDKVVAFGALRCIEGQLAMLDSYITLPTAPPLIRNRALDIITSKLLKIAKDNHIISVIAFSLEPSIIARAERHGLKSLQNTYQRIDLC